MNESRPRTREECKNDVRPCPWVGCGFHLYLDVDDNGGIIFNHENTVFNDDDLEDPDLRKMVQTCVLDIADKVKDGLTFCEIAEYLGCTVKKVKEILDSCIGKIDDGGEELMDN
ncbi:hypothetical protein HOG17_04270 [Candidatus Peregrinibacteria bacterium]|jgi:hypothetical protein|nr:hypothetical protein [Candidatus Peregrinibacteria bacterium]MBT4147974.1 hypothetical protein [Candidatus Peregrinibacteria bacterium]MBT4366119.1 hypothetical protein [Candidatus Peregrinibacteria bacterium]MBT4456223.1 hypothetical protein [Candidatus Peregrinibacteria bacterium]